MSTKEQEFEDFMEEYTSMVHYLIHQLHIRDPHKEYFQEGLLALWEVYRTYQEDKGKQSSYVYFIVRSRLIGLMRKQNKVSERNERVKEMDIGEGIHYDNLHEWDPYLYKKLIEPLTLNQKKWFWGYVIEDLSVKEIAEKERVSVDAVKNWGRLARKKLKENPDLMNFVGK